MWYRVKGSYSVEAAFLFPMLFFFLLFFILTGEWMLNRMVLKAAAAQSVAYGMALLDEGDEEAERKLQDYAEDAPRLFMLGETTLNANAKISLLNKITVEYEAKMEHPFFRYLERHGLRTFWNISTSQEEYWLNACTILRTGELLGEELK